MIWREKTRSKPTSLASAVITAGSSTRDRAGSGRPALRGGFLNSATVPSASVALPTVAEGKKPAAAAGSGPPWPAAASPKDAVAARSRVAARQRAALSASLARADAARSARRRAGVALVGLDEGVQEAGRFAGSWRTGPEDGDGDPGVDQDQVVRARPGRPG